MILANQTKGKSEDVRSKLLPRGCLSICKLTALQCGPANARLSSFYSERSLPKPTETRPTVRLGAGDLAPLILHVFLGFSLDFLVLDDKALLSSFQFALCLPVFLFGIFISEFRDCCEKG